MNINEAKEVLEDNGYILDEGTMPVINNIIKYYNKYIGTKDDRNYVQRTWQVWLGYTPTKELRKKIVDELLKLGYKAETFWYTDNVNHLIISGKIDTKKQTAAIKIKKLMDSANFKDLKELKDYLEKYI